jgi:hypothetical protein
MYQMSTRRQKKSKKSKKCKKCKKENVRKVSTGFNYNGQSCPKLDDNFKEINDRTEENELKFDQQEFLRIFEEYEFNLNHQEFSHILRIFIADFIRIFEDWKLQNGGKAGSLEETNSEIQKDEINLNHQEFLRILHILSADFIRIFEEWKILNGDKPGTLKDWMKYIESRCKEQRSKVLEENKTLCTEYKELYDK